MWGSLFSRVGLRRLSVGCFAAAAAFASLQTFAGIAGAVLPTSRSVVVGSPATVFATAVNSMDTEAVGCTVAPGQQVPADFSFVTTDPITNAVNGTADEPVNIAAGAAQTFLLTFTPTSVFFPTEIPLAFDCENTEPSLNIPGVTSVSLRSTPNTDVDLIAISSTVSQDGIVTINGDSAVQSFAVAAANVGFAGSVVASVDTGGATLPLNAVICQTDPLTGTCITPAAPSVPVTVLAGQSPSFVVFLQSLGEIDFNPATSRINVRFRSLVGDTLGSTSVAVRTEGDSGGNTPPLATAASPQLSASPGSLVTLDGSASADPDGDAIAYLWVLSTPDSSASALGAETSAVATFTPDVAGVYVAQLTVVDTNGAASVPTTVTVNVDGQLTITPASEFLNLVNGESVVLTTQVAYAADASITDNRSVSTTMTASGPITVITDPLPNFVVAGNIDQNEVFNMTIIGDGTGIGEVEISSTVAETGETSTVRVQFNVVAQTSGVAVFLPAAFPGFAPVGEDITVVASVPITGLEAGATPTVILQSSLASFAPVTLNDSAADGDLTAGDGLYSGTVSFAAADLANAGLQAGQCIDLFASVTQPGLDITSSTAEFCVSSFSTGVESNLAASNLLQPSDGGSQAIANELLVTFVSGTPDATISAIASTIDAQVVGAIHQIGLYQLQLNTPATSVDQLNAAIQSVQGFAEVTGASLNGLADTRVVTPDDPQFASQFHLSGGANPDIRTQEAWAVARGRASTTIAVVDTGVDIQHPDFQGKLLPGVDVTGPIAFFIGDGDDQSGHGTSVAGMAAANVNNTQDAAGVAWASRILPVRSSLTTFSAQLGIVVAASRGARIINASYGANGVAGQGYCNGIPFATSRGVLFVTAAHNDFQTTGIRTDDFPPACPGAFGVGSVDADGVTPSFFSNRGPVVDIAAFGNSIVTLANGGGTTTTSGNSFSSPTVAGAAAVLLDRDPSLSNADVVRILSDTAAPLPVNTNLGAGRLDLFEAVVNGSFEAGLQHWVGTDNASTSNSRGPFIAEDHDSFGLISSGPADNAASGSLEQTFTIQAGVTSLPISFRYNFVSEEFPEFCNLGFDDTFVVNLTNGGSTTEVFSTSVDDLCATALSPVALNFSGGDDTTEASGWLTHSSTVSVVPGSATLTLAIEDLGDDIFDTEVLVDGLAFAAAPSAEPAVANSPPKSVQSLGASRLGVSPLRGSKPFTVRSPGSVPSASTRAANATER